MKIRNGFVSNSSSSSFICDITGRVESGMDLDIEYAGMYQCQKGHTFDEDYHISPSVEEKRLYLINNPPSLTYEEETALRDNQDVEETSWIKACTLEDAKKAKAEKSKVFADKTYEEIEEIYEEMKEEERDRYVPSIECPICQMQEIIDEDLLKYMVKEFGSVKKTIVDKIKNDFSDYTSFTKYIKEES